MSIKRPRPRMPPVPEMLAGEPPDLAAPPLDDWQEDDQVWLEQEQRRVARKIFGGPLLQAAFELIKHWP